MSSIPRKAAPLALPVSTVLAPEEPVSVLAALVGAITNPDRYSVAFRDGELFIQRRSGASRPTR